MCGAGWAAKHRCFCYLLVLSFLLLPRAPRMDAIIQLLNQGHGPALRTVLPRGHVYEQVPSLYGVVVLISR